MVVDTASIALLDMKYPFRNSEKKILFFTLFKP